MEYLITPPQIKFLEELSNSHNCSEEFFDFIIEHHCYSGSFDEADITFMRCIEPYLDKFSRGNIIELLSGINYNNQLFNRSAAESDNTKIKRYADKKLGKKFNYSKYENLKFSDINSNK
ncbi:hypothetical protein [Piscibacillus salipiscarius]|uniref:hypothetical protein n=1 Tax=Piscibacillus salipiscarius TaxID=299480 RepID=UPI0006CF9943|nr:hypothetical protein [Piscibacillus salipiscarius]